ncbi:MAG: pyridoxal phosphate-dependent aminotransferase [Bacilli bacterium]
MLQISEKGKNAPSSPIRKLTPYADAATKRGIKIYHLNIGQPDIKSPEIIWDSLKNYDISPIAYTDSKGNISLREKICKRFANDEINFNLEDVLITTGGSEAMMFAFMSTLNAGDEVIIPEPYYANYTNYAVQVGFKIIPITAKIENGFALPSMEEFEKIITPKTKGIVIINPNNPTGYLYTQEELEQLSVIIKKHDLYLYADEVYRYYCYGGKHFSVMNLKNIEQNVILFDSMSKTYSECGIRIGELISRNKNVIASSLKFAMARLCPPALGQVVAEASMDTKQEYFDGVRQEYMTRRDVFISELVKIPGVVCPMPKGAFYAIAKLPVKSSEDFAKWLLEDYNYNGESVMVAPASGFYATEGMGLDEVRLAYVLKVEDLKKAVIILREALKVYPGRTK